MPSFQIVHRSQPAAAKCVCVQRVTHQQVPAALSILGGRWGTKSWKPKGESNGCFINYLWVTDCLSVQGACEERKASFCSLAAFPACACISLGSCGDVQTLGHSKSHQPLSLTHDASTEHCCCWKSLQEAGSTTQLHKPCVRERAEKGFRLTVFKHSLPNHLNPGKRRGNIPLIWASTAISLRTCPHFACSDKQTLYRPDPACCQHSWLFAKAHNL